MGNPLYGQNKADAVLNKIVKLFTAADGDGADNLQFQTFNTQVAASSTTNVTFSETVDVVEVWGGYIEISGANADFEFDVGYTTATTAFADDVGAGVNGLYALDADYLANAQDVILTINSNSSTAAINVEIVLLTIKPVTA